MNKKFLLLDLLACIVSLIVCVFTANENETANTIAFTCLCVTFFAPMAFVFYQSFKKYGL